MRPGIFHFSLAIAGTLVLAAWPVFAHHSFTAEFDVEKPVTFTGIVTGIEFYNPHVQVYLDVTAEDGKVEKWHLESGPPNQWQRGGLRKAMLAPGTMLKIRAYRAKDGTQNFAFLRDLTFLSGPQNGAHFELWIGGLDENGRPIYPGRQ
ncbi:MAG: DUF6152 family protein [Bryobacteraceae bacterium]